MKSGEAIRKALKNEDMTVSQLSRKCGYTSPSYVNNYLGRNMRVDKLVELASAIGYQVVLRNGEEEIEITDGKQEVTTDED